MEELSDMSGKNILVVEEIWKIDAVRVGDLPSAIKHEPLDASLVGRGSWGKRWALSF